MIVKVQNGAVGFGANIVFSHINFEVNKGEKIAIVGRNGCGKTSFLKLITGEYSCADLDDGNRGSVITANGIKIGYLSQVQFDDENKTLLDEVKSAYIEIINTKEQMEKALLLAEQGDSEQIQLYSKLEEHFNLLGGYSYKKEYETAIKKFGFSEEEKHKPLNCFSGGQRTKIAFIKLLLSKPDLLLLDEPTNHLDIEAVNWLEEYLASYKNSVVIVSHDREFLDKTVNIVYEIERGKMTRYIGNYTAFSNKKQIEWEHQQKEYIAQQKEIARLSGLVDRFRYKATKAAMAQSKLKQIEKMDIIEKPETADTRGFFGEFEPEMISVKQVLNIKDLQIGYSTPLSTVNTEIFKGEKIGIIGQNGSGKSTFLKTIVNKLPKLSGSITVGERVKIGYFDQQMAQYKSEKTVLDDYWDEFPNLTQTQVRSALGAFLFTGDDVFKCVNSLSGGEKVRLELCKIIRRRPNLLILDEPTNHMDIVGREVLENMLKNYSGTLVFVSHDRYFIRKIADKIIEFSDTAVNYYPYGYEQYLTKRQIPKAQTITNTKTDKPKEKKVYMTPAKQKATLERKIAKLEAQIAEAEQETNSINLQLQEPEISSDYIKTTELMNRLAELETLLEQLMTEWDEACSEYNTQVLN